MVKRVVLREPSKKEGGVLAKLWQNILKDTGYINKLELQVAKYEAKSKLPNAANFKSKATLVTNISSEDLTFRVFIDLLFNFLNVKKINISIKLTFANGDETIHNVAADNDNAEDIMKGFTKNDK